MAIGVITIFEEHSRDVVYDVLIRRYIKDYDLDCLQLSVECNCETFVSSSVVQRNLNNIWIGPRKADIDLVA